MTIVQYSAKHKDVWDRFIKSAKNTHFFFQRDYMEYHADKFHDFSLMVYNEKRVLIALLPANRQGSKLYSHQGLTFGGFIVQESMKVLLMLQIFQALKLFLRNHHIATLIYKTIPYIYHQKAAEEDRYALFRNGAKLYRVDVIGTIYLNEKIKYSNGRKWSINKAKKEKLHVEKSDDFTCFWPLLENVLQQRHAVKPVHTLNEMQYLASRFTENIKLYLVKKDSEIVAGSIIYENRHIAHMQYVANSNKGRDIGALDFLIDHLVKHVYSHKKYFDFGNSNEKNGAMLNEGLMDQKERFDARATVQEFYELDMT